MAELCLSGDNPAMSTARMKSKLARFRELEAADKWLLLRAVGWLAVARLMLIVMPFDRLAARLSAKGTASSEKPDPEYLEKISFAVPAAANNVPWRSDCFPQAIAAHKLLKRRGYESTIHLGVEKASPDAIAGHAWLTCGEVVVVGGEDLDRYTEMHRLTL